MNDRSQAIFGGIVLVVTISLVVMAVIFLSGSGDSSANFVATTAAPITSADHIQGDASSTVSVIEYGDFECPACGAYEPVVEELEKEYDSKILFVFRNFPLTQIHPNAMAGAEAAEAAGLQGKYWQMHDLLFAKQSGWSIATGSAVENDLNAYATSLGLDVTRFDVDMHSSAIAAKIQSDINSGNAAKINHTPTFFVNLTQIQNPTSYASFKSVIDAALAGH